MTAPCPDDFPTGFCPIRDILDRIGDKWTLLILASLNARKMRFNELQRELGEISHKVLVETLRKLEREGYLLRTEFEGYPSHVEYELSDLGQSILAPIQILIEWAKLNRDDIEKAREIFDDSYSEKKYG